MSDEYEDEAESALHTLARDLVIELGAAKAAEILELAGHPEESAFPGQPGRDPYGRFPPAAPGPQAGWFHTLRAQHNRTHLLGADPFMAQLYGREPGPGRDAAAGAHWGGQSPQDGQQEAGPAAQLPEAELNARGLYQAARGVTAAPAADLPIVPEAQPGMPGAPQQPARRPRDRYGRRRVLRYRGRR